jgi:hypothetical protein
MLMNPTFASHIEAVPKPFAFLKEATPFVEKGLVTQRKRPGIHVFLENDIPRHVGANEKSSAKAPRPHYSEPLHSDMRIQDGPSSPQVTGDLQYGRGTGAASKRSCL